MQFRRDLHRIPELGFQEEKTSAYLQAALTEMGLRPRVVAGTGVIADIDGLEGAHGRDGDQGSERINAVDGRRHRPTVLVRADMDGLPLAEASGEPFASGHAGVMHACGHDGHMAMVLALALRLSRERRFPGRVRVAFQPSEEKPPGGAPAMIAAGCLEGVDRVLGCHLWTPLAVGEAILPVGAVMANADEFVVRIEGRGGHAASPQQTRDAVVVAAQTVVNLQTIVARRIDPLEPAVVTCGSIRAGETFNVIADRAEILGTVRTLSAAVRERIRGELERVVEATAAMHEARAQLEYIAGYPAVVNPAQPASVVRRALSGLLRVAEGPPSLAGEDFAYYLRQRPGVYFLLGAQAPDGFTPHHSPRFRWDEAALGLGTEALYRSVHALLADVGTQKALA